MPPQITYITSSCVISQGIVLKDGKQLFENKAADVQAFLLAVYQHFGLNYSKFYKMDNLSKLGWLASEVLLDNTLKKGDYQPEEVGLVLANRNSSLDNDLKYFDSIKDIPSPSLFVYTLPNIVIGEICIRSHFKGEHAFYIQENFDAGFIENQVNYLLNNNILQACICGWVDILADHYKAALFLVGKQNNDGAIPFSAENMNAVFNQLT
ncbi:MAG: hypothetical protein JSU01_13040 [Bacteroidetes bacterium]|nr:hypothetical protein [Bacteroidota bacterium]